MMKALSTFLFILSASLVLAQNQIEKTVGEFSTLKVYDLINVTLVKSDDNKVEISGRNANSVVIVNKNGTLKIRMELEEYFDGNRTDITLYYTDFDVLDANEGGYISSSDVIKKNRIEIRSQEGSQVKVPLEVNSTEIKAYTGGIVNLKGSSKDVIYRINTGGIAETRDLAVEKATIKIRAGGEVELSAEVIDVNIRAGGDVFIFGDPKTVKDDRALGGRIIYMDN